MSRTKLQRRAGAARLAFCLVALIGLAGCKTTLSDFSATLTTGAADGAAAPRDLERLGRSYDAKPGEKQASLRYAAALRASGQHAQALAVLQRASVVNVGDRDVAGAYGKVLAETGRTKEAEQVLSVAHAPDRPDWKLLSTQGTVADQTGDHARARELYTNALQIAPGEPSVLANLALSHVLTRDLDKAEAYLREAAKHPRADRRVRANLALVLALQGKFEDSEKVASQDLRPEEVAANTAAIRSMLRQDNSWDRIREAEASRGKPRRG